MVDTRAHRMFPMSAASKPTSTFQTPSKMVTMSVQKEVSEVRSPGHLSPLQGEGDGETASLAGGEARVRTRFA
jgi:hypothetical protein